MEAFVCHGGPDTLSLSPSLAEAMSLTAPEQLHLSSAAMIEAARRMERSGWTRLPFCNTLCSEGLGAKPVLSMTGARVKEPPYASLDQLPRAFSADFPRMSALLGALDELTADGASIAYSIEGPFTLLTSLLPMGKIFSALRKPYGQELLDLAENWICQYAGLICSHGAKLLSFADPVATPDIIGDKLFTTVYVPCMKKILHRIQAENPGIPLFLCGKMTQGLLDRGICRTVGWIPHTACTTFGQALSAFCAQQKPDTLLGHFCLNLLDARRPYVEEIIFINEEKGI